MTQQGISDLIAWRQFLHQRPEISGQEAETAEHVRARLAGLNPDTLITGLGGLGVLARFCGSDPKVRILLRCELDGLPITETNTFAHRSMVEGKGHLCGHDGHMAILTGVAEALSARRMPQADVLLLFQPAEETGAGAKAVLQDPTFQDYVPDLAVALHNMPGLPLGQIQVRAGAVCCASRGLRIELMGRTAHASQPETGLSPAAAMIDIMKGLEALNTPDPAGGVPPRMATITHANLGEPTFGVAPGAAEVRVTLRTILDPDMSNLCQQAEALVSDACGKAGLRYSLAYHDVFSAATNDENVARIVTSAAAASKIDCRAQPAPMRWSEDFGRFGSVCPSALFLLGAGTTCPALHNPDYDFPDALIETGVQAFLGVLAGAVR